MVDQHDDDAVAVEGFVLSAAQARNLLAQGRPGRIRIEDREDGLWYVANTEPPIDLGLVYDRQRTLQQQLEWVCERYDKLRAEVREHLYPPRHLGEVLLSDEALHKLLAVPEGLRIVSVRRDEARRTLVVTVEAEEGGDLPLVFDGCEAPVIAAQWEYTHVEIPPASDEDVTGEGQASELLTYGRLDWWPHG